MASSKSTSQGGLDLEVVALWAKSWHQSNPKVEEVIDALIDRVRDLEAVAKGQYDNARAWENQLYRSMERVASLLRVREAAVNYEEAAVRHRVVIYPEVTALRAALADSEEGR